MCLQHQIVWCRTSDYHVIRYVSATNTWEDLGQQPHYAFAGGSEFLPHCLSEDEFILHYMDAGGTYYLARHDGAWHDICSFTLVGDTPDCICAFAADDIWLGTLYGKFRHWDGVAWTQTTPFVFPFPSIQRFHAIATDDIWASCGSGWIAHWDGISWTKIATGFPTCLLEDIWASAADDIWVVGADGGVSGPPVVLHWDGAVWSNLTVASGLASPARHLRVTGSTVTNEVLITGYELHNGPSRWNGSAFTLLNPGCGFYDRYRFQMGVILAVDVYLCWGDRNYTQARAYRGTLGGWTELALPGTTSSSASDNSDGFGLVAPPVVPVYPVKLPSAGFYIDQIRG